MEHVLFEFYYFVYNICYSVIFCDILCIIYAIMSLTYASFCIIYTNLLFSAVFVNMSLLYGVVESVNLCTPVRYEILLF